MLCALTASRASTRPQKEPTLKAIAWPAPPESTFLRQARLPICASRVPVAHTRQLRGPIRPQCASIVRPVRTQEILATMKRQTAAHAERELTHQSLVLPPSTPALTVWQASIRTLNARRQRPPAWIVRQASIQQWCLGRASTAVIVMRANTRGGQAQAPTSVFHALRGLTRLMKELYRMPRANFVPGACTQVASALLPSARASRVAQASTRGCWEQFRRRFVNPVRVENSPRRPSQTQAPSAVIARGEPIQA